jgi:saccharopine dehydrogenase-like NADP-dependent oxidoreductase
MEKMNVIVLGGVLVGGPMALDLAAEESFAVTVVDIDEAALENLWTKDPRLGVIQRDLSNPSRVNELASEADIVLNAVPGFMGYPTLSAIIDARKPAADISFLAEDPFTLEGKAKEAGVTAVVDYGVSPRLSNLVIGRVVQQIHEMDSILIYVGGLPEVRHWPMSTRRCFHPSTSSRSTSGRRGTSRTGPSWSGRRCPIPSSSTSRDSAPSKHSTPTV